MIEDLPQIVAKSKAAIQNESDGLYGERMKIIIPSNIINILTKLEVLLGFKLSGQTNTLTEANILMEELYKRGQIQNEQNFPNALDKIHTL